MRSFIIMGKAMSSAAERRKSMSKAKKAMRTLFAIVQDVVNAVNWWYIFFFAEGVGCLRQAPLLRTDGRRLRIERN